MAPSACRGQILAEMIWILLLIISFTVFISQLYQNAVKAHGKPRWEIKSERAK